jgi:hypothetical protein
VVSAGSLLLSLSRKQKSTPNVPLAGTAALNPCPASFANPGCIAVFSSAAVPGPIAGAGLPFSLNPPITYILPPASTPYSSSSGSGNGAALSQRNIIGFCACTSVPPIRDHPTMRSRRSLPQLL